MTVQESVKQCLWKYADFSGRATRAEFWWWVLLTTIGLIVFYGVAGSIYASGDLVDALPFTLSGITFQLLTLFPSLAVTARRLHDLGRSGWLSLLCYAGIYIGISLSFLTWALVAVLVVEVSTSSGDLYDVISVLGLILSIPVAVIVTAVCTAFVVSLAQQGHAGLNRFGPDPRAMDTLKSTADV